MDNASATGVTVNGSWPSSKALSGYWGSNYLHDNNAQKGTKSIRFTPSLPSSGTYQVFARWVADTNRASNVPYDIVHAGGTTTVLRDQRSQSNTWVSLGTFTFNAGTGSSVLLRTTSTNGFVIADAIRWVGVN